MPAESARHQFIAIAGLPGRLTTQEAVWLLGFAEHDIPVLVSHRMLKPLGDPPPNGSRFYAYNELDELRHDRKWLHKASALLVIHWKTKNAKRRPRSSNSPAGFMNRARRKKGSLSNGETHG